MSERHVQRVLPFAGARAAADPSDPEHTDHGHSREWLVTNGLGGYAAGTLSGRITRRFHGLLIAALPAPLARALVFNRLSEVVQLPDGQRFRLGEGNGSEDVAQLPALPLIAIRFDQGLPTWRFGAPAGPAPGFLERQIWMEARKNTTRLVYRLSAGAPWQLELRPWLHFRPHAAPLDSPAHPPYLTDVAEGDGWRGLTIRSGLAGFPPLRLLLAAPGEVRFAPNAQRLEQLVYAIEQSRGYDSIGSLQSPGAFILGLAPEQPAALTASTEPETDVQGWASSLEDELARRQRLLDQADLPAAAADDPARPFANELVLAADQFVVHAAYREGTLRTPEDRTVIAGYPWFTDWGRDTMISLEGLTLVTGRASDARRILRAFAHAARDGLIPNMFPEGNESGLYHTADATLWYFHALDRYLARSGDQALLAELLPTLRDIIAHHLTGTRFGIAVDSSDGLLRQGKVGYQLTWMDAKVGDLVVTPRRGKAVEINALFYNALRLLSGWTAAAGQPKEAQALGAQADRTFASFNRRFWRADAGCLFDVVDGWDEQEPDFAGGHASVALYDDPAFRPNQILAISLRHPVLLPERWSAVVEAVQARLLTPLGLRSLAPGEPHYQPRYYGDLHARDLAYHQGTVWAWLIGPFVDAWLKVHPGQRAQASQFLQGFVGHLDEACVGSISEIFDAEPPFTPRGCFAQAWSVAEVLRCVAATVSAG